MLSYLCKHRFRPPFGSALWFKQWAKRIWTFPSLMGFAWRTYCLKQRGARIAEGSVLSRSRFVGQCHKLWIGRNSFIGRVSLQLHERIEIGSNVCINDGVNIITASHDVRDPAWKLVAKPVRILDHAWIGTGATILPGVTIGHGAVVGAFAVVAKDVPDYAVVVGNPGRVRENVRCRELNYSPVQFLAYQTAWLGSTQENKAESKEQKDKS